MNLILFILIGVGITNIVVNASILEGVRDYISKKSLFFEKLLNCMLCSGFWIGLLLSLFGILDINLIFGGAIISLVSYTYDSLMQYIHIVSSTLEAEIEYESEAEDE